MDIFLSWLGEYWFELITAVTSVAALAISMMVWTDRRAADVPAMMVVVNSYENGATLTVTVRNRADHPMSVTSISVDQKPDIELAMLKSKDKSGTISAEGFGSKSVEQSATLNSRDDPASKDSAKREFAILSYRAMPERFWVYLTYDPQGGRSKKKIAKREVVIPARWIGQRTAIELETKPRYSLAAKGRA